MVRRWSGHWIAGRGLEGCKKYFYLIQKVGQGRFSFCNIHHRLCKKYTVSVVIWHLLVHNSLLIGT